jgi:hypothetical protein
LPFGNKEELRNSIYTVSAPDTELLLPEHSAIIEGRNNVKRNYEFVKKNLEASFLNSSSTSRLFYFFNHLFEIKWLCNKPDNLFWLVAIFLLPLLRYKPFFSPPPTPVYPI